MHDPSDHSHDHAHSDHDHAHDHEAAPAAERWKHDGVRVIPGDKLDSNTAQTPGMFRQAAINHARVGAQKIWAGTVAIADTLQPMPNGGPRTTKSLQPSVLLSTSGWSVGGVPSEIPANYLIFS